MYVEFSGLSGYELATKSLEDNKNGIRLLNIRDETESNVTKATVYIPEGKHSLFLQKIRSYETQTTKKGNPRYNDLIRSIEDVSIAIVKSFWIGNITEIPGENAKWCEVWLRYDTKDDYDIVNEEFDRCCSELNIEFNDKRIRFPERAVRLIRASYRDLEELLYICDYVAEFRNSFEPASFFTELSGKEQQEIVDEIIKFTSFNDSKTTICLLDTGIMQNHPLLKSAIKDDKCVISYDSNWGAEDHEGHGTEMAGIAKYFDLMNTFLSKSQVSINHKIESVKILPPHGSNKYEAYGAITEQSVLSIEIENPDANRVICMAITCDNDDGKPTSWSGAIDNITSGANEEGGVKRLFFISAGNVNPEELKERSYPNSSILHSVESPGQAWNAITVGCYSKNIDISDESIKGFHPVADVGELSPYSSTSMTWGTVWPVKPELLLDGGNVATNDSDYISSDDLSLLTTNKDFLIRPLSSIWATSAATAQASWMAAQVYSLYPDIWPETVRALLIHSARWTDKMKKQFCSENTKTKGRRQLLRTCGYGIPDLEKAIQCYNNSVNLVIESEIQPYTKGSMNEMHIHKIPWPKDVLLENGELPATLRVTLSYFIEPGPGEIGWKNKYRYSSCGLRFDVINSNETLQDFKKRVNNKMREDSRDSGDGSSRDWFLGTQNRDVGPIHSDFCETTAADLSDANYVAVYPVVGWWRERTNLGKFNNKIRYSLIVSIETPVKDIDIYTPIINQIAIETPAN